MCKQRGGAQKYHKVIQQAMETRDYSASQEAKLNTKGCSRPGVDLSHLYWYHSSSTVYLCTALCGDVACTIVGV